MRCKKRDCKIPGNALQYRRGGVQSHRCLGVPGIGGIDRIWEARLSGIAGRFAARGHFGRQAPAKACRGVDWQPFVLQFSGKNFILFNETDKIVNDARNAPKNLIEMKENLKKHIAIRLKIVYDGLELRAHVWGDAPAKSSAAYCEWQR